MVMHQSRHTEVCLVGGRIDIQGGIVILAPENHLLTPVAEDVCQEAGCSFRAVARRGGSIGIDTRAVEACGQ